MSSFIKKIKEKFKNYEFDYLNKIANDLVSPKDRTPISSLSARQSPLYRVGKRKNLDRYLSDGIRTTSSSSDLGDDYLDENGNEEFRSYFFSDLNSVMITVLSSNQDIDAIIGSISDEEIVILTIDPQILSKEVKNLYLYEDKELSVGRSGLSSVYITGPDCNEKWVVPASSIVDHKTLDEILSEEDDDIYEEMQEDSDFEDY